MTISEPSASTPSNDLLNALYPSYMGPGFLYNPTRLRETVQAQNLDVDPAELERAFKAPTDASYDFLWGLLGTEPKNRQDLMNRSDQIMREAAPWMNAANFAIAVQHAMYMAWHDGLLG